VRWQTIVSLLVVAGLLSVSAGRTNIGKGLRDTCDAAVAGLGAAVGIEHDSKTATGLARFAEKAFPPVIAREQPVDLIEGDFDPRTDLPWLAHVETRDVLDPAGRVVGRKQVLVEPVGYLVYVVGLMLKTIEIAVWGTLLAVVLAVPLACFGAANFSPHPIAYWGARGLCSLSRSLHELILALIFVVMYGIGPFAGVLALGFHCAGFLGKFFADDTENAPRGPQKALTAAGASKIQVIRYAVLPQIMPQVFAYVQYILERNIRSATVLGIVGAGGIGLELIGQWKLYKYGHAMTIVLVTFATVVLLELVTQRLRARVI
jgi:phosphonate transport system permease protein